MPKQRLLNLEHDIEAGKIVNLQELYQQLRQMKAREEYEQGTARTFMDMFKEAPGRYISFILAIILICYFMIFLFFNLH